MEQLERQEAPHQAALVLLWAGAAAAALLPLVPSRLVRRQLRAALLLLPLLSHTTNMVHTMRVRVTEHAHKLRGQWKRLGRDNRISISR